MIELYSLLRAISEINNHQNESLQGATFDVISFYHNRDAASYP